MNWSESICLSQPLHDVVLLEGAPTQDWSDVLAEREQAAYERGRRDGEKDLREQLLQQRADMAEVQQGVIQSLRQTLPRIAQQSETALTQLALEAARRVVADLPISAELVEAVVRDALRQVEDTAEITVHLHPEDLDLLRRHESPLLRAEEGRNPVHVIASSEVTRGGCMVQTCFGLLDARRETKWEQLRKTLTP